MQGHNLEKVMVVLTEVYLRHEAILPATHVPLLLAEAPVVRVGLKSTEVEGCVFRPSSRYWIEVGNKPAGSRGGMVADADAIKAIHGIL